MKLGTLVRYWKGIRAGEPTGTARTRTPIEMIAGQKVVWLCGVSGCVALTHIEPVEQLCRVCGCSESNACENFWVPNIGCHWVEIDLCSECHRTLRREAEVFL